MAAVRLAGEHRAAVAALDEARAAFGDRRRLDPRALYRALGLPADVPAELERLQAEFLAAFRRRAELVARLDAGAASDLASPSAPWVITLARQPHTELWNRAAAVRAARVRAAELSMGLGGAGQHGALVAEIEAVHQLVEEAERDLAAARVKPLAVKARRRLAQAREGEEAVLARAGFVSWLAFQMRRIDVLLEPDALEALRVAELEHQVAAVAWAELAGDVDPDAALAARDEIERYAERDGRRRAQRRGDRAAPPGARRGRRARLRRRPGGAARSLRVVRRRAGARRVRGRRHRVGGPSRPAAADPGGRRGRPPPHRGGPRGRHWRRPAVPAPATSPSRLEAVTGLAAAAALHLEATRSTRSPEEVEADLGRARAALARLARPEWENLPAPPAFPPHGR